MGKKSKKKNRDANAATNVEVDDECQDATEENEINTDDDPMEETTNEDVDVQIQETSHEMVMSATENEITADYVADLSAEASIEMITQRTHQQQTDEQSITIMGISDYVQRRKQELEELKQKKLAQKIREGLSEGRFVGCSLRSLRNDGYCC